MNDPEEKRGSTIVAAIAMIVFGICMLSAAILIALLVFGDFCSR